jgi:hypothetical protein
MAALSVPRRWLLISQFSKLAYSHFFCFLVHRNLQL